MYFCVCSLGDAGDRTPQCCSLSNLYPLGNRMGFHYARYIFPMQVRASLLLSLWLSVYPFVEYFDSPSLSFHICPPLSSSSSRLPGWQSRWPTTNNKPKGIYNRVTTICPGDLSLPHTNPDQAKPGHTKAGPEQAKQVSSLWVDRQQTGKALGSHESDKSKD